MCSEWATALASVDRRVPCKSVVPRTRAGLMYPDPGYMVSITPQNRAYALAAWLSVRAARCGQMLYPTSSQKPVIPASVWRQFFWIYRRQPLPSTSSSQPSNATVITASDTGDPLLDDELDAATNAAKSMFGTDMVSTMNRTTREVYWRGKAYDVVEGAVVGMESHVVREIVWELAELNWRYELLALDKFAAPHMWMDQDVAGARTSAILAVFAPSASFVFTHAPFPTENASIAAASPGARLKAFTALRRIMSAWPRCPAPIQHAVSDFVPSSSQCPETRVVEGQTMLFYCQTFYEYFHHPPIIPCMLPS